MNFDVEFSLKGALREDAEAHAWVAYCPSLKVYSQGANKAEAEEALRDAAHSFLLVCLERQLLEGALAKRGFSASSETQNQKTEGQQAEKAEWITVRQRFDKGEFDFKVSVPFHLAHALSQHAA